MATAEDALEIAEEALELARENKADIDGLADRVADLEELCGKKPPVKARRRMNLEERVARLEELNRANPQAMTRSALEREEKDRGQSTIEGGKVPTGEI
ncbi:MAG: hypothetical protein OXU25_01495 [Thaumarchaeota archaeon]|nr:hypothetical protein [Nitrososphaerota archaeon]